MEIKWSEKNNYREHPGSNIYIYHIKLSYLKIERKILKQKIEINKNIEMMWLNVNRIIAIFATLLLLETTGEQKDLIIWKLIINYNILQFLLLAAANITCMSCDKDENCLNGVATTTCENATKCFTRVNGKP